MLCGVLYGPRMRVPLITLLLPIWIAMSSITSGDVYESFDGWTTDTAYAGLATYSNAASGVWATENALCNTQNERSGRAIRFNQAAPAPYLEYRGMNGGGITGTITSISFYYRHWDGDANQVRFVVQTSTNGIAWTSISPTQSVTSTTYQEFRHTNAINAQGLFIRVQSIAFNERLLIDDFAITLHNGPVISLTPGQRDVQETTGTAIVWAVLSPPGEGSVDIVANAGTATPGEDFILITTSMVFTAGSSSQAVEVAILDDEEAEANETLTISLTNLNGLTAAPAAITSLITIIDNEAPSISFVSGSTLVNENGGPVSIPIQISHPSDATVSVQVAGTAMIGQDFTMSSTTVVFSVDGPDIIMLDLDIIDNSDGASDKFVMFTLVDASGANLAFPVTHLVTIMDDEPRVWLEPSELILEEGATGATLRVVLSHAAPATVTINLTGPSISPADIALSVTTLVFTAETSPTQTVFLSVLRDTLAEGPENGVLVPGGLVGAFPDTSRVCRLSVRDGDAMTIMAANLTSGGDQKYLGAGERLLRGLMPDIVAIQEFNVTNSSRRAFVDATFGTNFHFMVEPFTGSIPNGIISRWPIIASGEWDDPMVGNRDFAWATIDIPGPRNLHVISAHFLTSGSADRNTEAQALIANVSSAFSPDDYLVIAGDFNTEARGEACIVTLSSTVSDGIQPADQNGNRNTNQGRVRPYDYVLPNGHLEAWHVPTRVEGLPFPDGVVFDSRLWTNGTAPPRPIQVADANTEGMQHMPVMKTFAFATGVVVQTQIDRIIEQGNGNGLIETGELATAYFSIRNVGAVTATQLVLHIESLTPDLILTGAFFEALADIPVAGVYTTLTPCVFRIATNATAGDHELRAVLSWGDSATTNTVIVNVFINRIDDALDNYELGWTFWGSWEYQTNITYDGEDALVSDYVPGNSMNWVKTVVEGPGMLTYAWSIRTSSANPGYLFSQRNGGYDFQFKSSSTWQVFTNIIPAGIHTMEWYHVNYSATPSRSTGVLDRVTFQLFTNPVINASLQNTSLILNDLSGPTQYWFYVRNIGSGILNYTATVNAAWITLEQNGVALGSGQTGYVDVRIDHSTLSTGQYQAAIVVSSPDSIPAAITGIVSLVVSGPLPHGAGMTNLVFYTAGDAAWFIQSAVTHDGVSAARSGLIPHNRQTYLESEVVGPGTLSFWWKVSSEQGYDFLTYRMNSTNAASISGNVDWQFQQYAFTAGVHRVRWTYSKDASVTNFLDAAFVDEVVMTGIPDRDADGIPDAWEMRYYGTPTGAIVNASDDADGFSNYEEYIADSDPTNAASYFEGVVKIEFSMPMQVQLGQTSTQRVYDLFATTNLLADEWQTLSTNVTGTGSNLTLAVTNQMDNMKFRGQVRMGNP